jgi:hypothetical protein
MYIQKILTFAPRIQIHNINIAKLNKLTVKEWKFFLGRHCKLTENSKNLVIKRICEQHYHIIIEIKTEKHKTPALSK